MKGVVMHDLATVGTSEIDVIPGQLTGSLSESRLRLHFICSRRCRYHEDIAEGYLVCLTDLEDNDSNITFLVASPVLKAGSSAAKTQTISHITQVSSKSLRVIPVISQDRNLLFKFPTHPKV